jgi:hypothetical protein
MPVAYADTAEMRKSGKNIEVPSSGAAGLCANSARINETPDLMQSNPEAALPGGGMTYCGPVAASNSFVWLGAHGFDRFYRSGGTTEVLDQGKLALDLGQCMGTNKDRGTSPSSMLLGLDKFVKERGYKIETLRYQGWENHPARFSAGRACPSLAWIKDSLSERSIVLLMIGWYHYKKDTDTYRMFAQHWLTLVGYGQDKQGRRADNVLIVHDPAPRSGIAFSSDYIKCQPLHSGRFTGRRRNASANGFCKLTGDLKIKKGADCGILDGALVLSLIKPAKSDFP